MPIYELGSLGGKSKIASDKVMNGSTGKLIEKHGINRVKQNVSFKSGTKAATPATKI